MKDKEIVGDWSYPTCQSMFVHLFKLEQLIKHYYIRWWGYFYDDVIHYSNQQRLETLA